MLLSTFFFSLAAASLHFDSIAVFNIPSADIESHWPYAWSVKSQRQVASLLLDQERGLLSVDCFTNGMLVVQRQNGHTPYPSHKQIKYNEDLSFAPLSIHELELRPNDVIFLVLPMDPKQRSLDGVHTGNMLWSVTECFTRKKNVNELTQGITEFLKSDLHDLPPSWP